MSLEQMTVSFCFVFYCSVVEKAQDVNVKKLLHTAEVVVLFRDDTCIFKNNMYVNIIL